MDNNPNQNQNPNADAFMDAIFAIAQEAENPHEDPAAAIVHQLGLFAANHQEAPAPQQDERRPGAE